MKNFLYTCLSLLVLTFTACENEETISYDETLLHDTWTVDTIELDFFIDGKPLEDYLDDQDIDLIEGSITLEDIIAESIEIEEGSYITFHEDGTFTTLDTAEGNTETVSGKYTLEADNLSMISNEDEEDLIVFKVADLTESSLELYIEESEMSEGVTLEIRLAINLVKSI